MSFAASHQLSPPTGASRRAWSPCRSRISAAPARTRSASAICISPACRRDAPAALLPSTVAPSVSTSTATPLSPQRSCGMPTTQASATRGMGQQHLLDLARIHVRAAGDVHVRRAAGDVDEAPCVHVAKVAGVEPAEPRAPSRWPPDCCGSRRTRRGRARRSRRWRRAAGGCRPASRIVISMPVRGKPQLPTGMSASSRLCRCGGSTVMLPVTSPMPKYCTSTWPELAPARASGRRDTSASRHRSRSAGRNDRSDPPHRAASASSGWSAR